MGDGGGFFGVWLAKYRENLLKTFFAYYIAHTNKINIFSRHPNGEISLGYFENEV